MRILLLNQFYPPDIAPTGQLLADVALGLVRSGHEVHVICSAGTYAGGRAEDTGRRDRGGVRVHRVGATGRGRIRATDRLLDWGSYYALAAGRALRLGRFDTTVALTSPPFIGALGALLKRSRGTRLVIWCMDMWPDVAEALGMIRPRSFTARALRRCAASMYGVADHVVSLGWTMSDRLGRYGVYQDRVSAVHNWVPGESVRALDPGTCGLTGSPAREGAFLVMYSGNMGMAHEFDTILDAAGLLQGEGAVRFEFVGGGRRRREVQEGAAARGLRNVAFMESRPMGDLAILLGSADAHLVSMRGEATGMLVPSKIYGILAAGRPALFVGPSQCEVSDLIGASGGGARFSPGDAHGLADLIRTLSADRAKARRLGEKGRAYYDRFLGRDRSVAAIVAVVTGSSAPARAPLAAGLFRPQTEAAVPSETPVCEAQG